MSFRVRTSKVYWDNYGASSAGTIKTLYPFVGSYRMRDFDQVAVLPQCRQTLYVDRGLERRVVGMDLQARDMKSTLAEMELSRREAEAAKRKAKKYKSFMRETQATFSPSSDTYVENMYRTINEIQICAQRKNLGTTPPLLETRILFFRCYFGALVASKAWAI